ncbi:MAG: ornithine cyclodeaminase family protein [Thermoanaerobaculia bacterium]|nr:ornithine cyclodeaminase family protein [Thermoanaerobaculia bacterium]
MPSRPTRDPVLLIGQVEVRRLLPMGRCIDLMGEALAALGRGDGLNPLRSALPTPDGSGLLCVMPGYLGAPPVVGIKVITIFEGNHAAGLDSHQGWVLLFDAGDGRPVAAVDAGEITAIRTAAVSGLATRLLARPDASSLALLGSGVQARTHLEAMLAVRPIERIRVWSRTRSHAEALAAGHQEAGGEPVEVVDTPRAAVEDADLVCTTTASPEPIVEGGWLAPGCHLNDVGSSVANERELDTEAVRRSRLFVDRRESTLNEAGDFLIPRAEGAVDDGHIVGELGEILLGECEGRRSAEEITLFKSLGLAVEDLAAAHHVYREASRLGAGARFGLTEPPPPGGPGSG